MVKRAAFSLIELVLAIVIIAISVMTIPLMLSQSGNNDSFSLIQESILAARTKMGNVLTYEWDRNSTIGTGTDTYIRVLDVVNGDNDLNRTVGTVLRRVGHVVADKRRRFHDLNGTLARPSGIVNSANIQSIDDFDQQNVNMVDTNKTDGFDYVMDFNMTTRVSYISDNANYALQNLRFDFNTTTSASITDVNNSTNIKMIEVLVQSNDGLPFTFRAFSSNIGQTELLELPVTN